MYQDQRGCGIPNPKELIKAIIYGIAVGDALGFPVQFLDRAITNRYPVVDMGFIQYEEGKLKRVEEDLYGLWSDDTSLALCLAESLATGFCLRDQAQKMLDWYYEGYLSAKDRAFDVGIQTRIGLQAVRKIMNAGEYDKLEHLMAKPKESANGNGVLMKILPLLLHTYHLDIRQQLEIVTRIGALTHPHIRSALCCLFYLLYAQRLVDRQDKVSALDDTRKDMIALMQTINTDARDRAELQRLCYADIAGFSADLQHRDEAHYVHSTGYVVHSLEAALWCLLNNNNYRDTVLAATRLGLDTDTIAAICGGLAAIIYGYEGIPEDWINALKKPELIKQVIALYQ